MTKRVSPKDVPDTTELEELHCGNSECGKFIGYANIESGLISIKCHRCKTNNLKFSFNVEMPTILTANEVKCKNCDRFLYSSALTNGTVKVKCRICGEWDTLEIRA